MSEHDSTWASGAPDDRVSAQSPPQEHERRQAPTPAATSEPAGFVGGPASEAPTTAIPAGSPHGGYPAPGSPYQAPGAPYQSSGVPYHGLGAPYQGPAGPGAQAGAPYPTAPYPGAPGWPPAAPAPRSGSRLARGVVIGVAAIALALFSGVTGGFVAHQFERNGSAPTVTRNAAPVVDRSSVAAVAAAVQPSVVDITVGNGEGSGVVISADGYILTNNHVVESGRGNSLDVTFNNGKTAKATIVGTDPAGDLALVKAQGVSDLTPARFGDSDAVQVGDTVLAGLLLSN